MYRIAAKITTATHSTAAQAWTTVTHKLPKCTAAHLVVEMQQSRDASAQVFQCRMPSHSTSAKLPPMAWTKIKSLQVY
jgi:hypothetical protein